MRMFFTAVGILAWIWAMAVLFVFAESGGPLTVIAAGVFAIVAIVALVGERIIKTLEEIRDSSVTRIRINDSTATRDVEVRAPIDPQPVL